MSVWMDIHKHSTGDEERKEDVTVESLQEKIDMLTKQIEHLEIENEYLSNRLKETSKKLRDFNDRLRVTQYFRRDIHQIYY